MGREHTMTETKTKTDPTEGLKTDSLRRLTREWIGQGGLSGMTSQLKITDDGFGTMITLTKGQTKITLRLKVDGKTMRTRTEITETKGLDKTPEGIWDLWRTLITLSGGKDYTKTA